MAASYLYIPSLSLSLWHRSVSAGRCISMGPACRSHPKEKKAVPLFPEFFVVGLHCSPPLVYSIVRLIVSLRSLSFSLSLSLSLARRTARERAAEYRGDGGRGDEEEGSSKHCVPGSAILLPSHLFPSLPSCFCGIVNRLVTAPPRLLIGEVMVGKYDGSVRDIIWLSGAIVLNSDT